MTAPGSLGLAAKYRPRSFGTIIGQDPIVSLLRAAVARRKVPQQILLSGRSGLGKTTLARVVAAALLCETPMEARDNGDACSHCPACSDSLTPGRSHPDLIEFDAASHGGKDEIRDIAARCHVAPMRADTKVYVIDEAHGLSNPGGQAFLKLLEEPPDHVVFILCTTDPQKMLKTNRGRCVEFELRTPSRQELETNLQRVAAGEHWSPEPRVLAAVIEGSDPELGVRGTVSTLAKLSMALEDEGNPSDEVVASLLGTPPPRAVGRLLDAITSLDRKLALTELESLRTVAPDTAIRTALTRWATGQVKASLIVNPDRIPLAVWRLEQTLLAGPEREWLDVLVARLAAPDIDAPPAAVIDEARAVLAELVEATAAAAHAALPADSPGTAAPQRGPSPEVAQLLAASAPAPDGLAEVLAICTVSISDGVVTVLVPSASAGRMSPFGSTLKSAAGRLGLTLKLRRAGPETP